MLFNAKMEILNATIFLDVIFNPLQIHRGANKLDGVPGQSPHDSSQLSAFSSHRGVQPGQGIRNRQATLLWPQERLCSCQVRMCCGFTD